MITLEDALKSNRPVSFCTLIKPLGSVCNLKCTYCYYLDKELQYGAKPKLMSDELLEQYIIQYIAANAVPQVDFYWHGGEPLMAGLDFFERAMALQQKYRGDKRITNTIQTNGTLINDRWGDFFARNHFLVGLSIDGDEVLHNATRHTKNGEGTFDSVIKGLDFLKRHHVEFNTLTTVNSFSKGRGAETYRFLKSIGSRYIQFLPVLEYVNKDGIIVSPSSKGDKQLSSLSVSGEDYGEFLIDVFKDWVVADVGRYFVQIFDATLANSYGVPPGTCTVCKTCGDSLAVEHNGDVYSCDHFVYPEHKLGNIKNETLLLMYKSGQQFDFGCKKQNALPQNCKDCQWLHLCNGECPKHRFENGVNSLCAGLKAFYAYTHPYMEFMCQSIKNGKLASEVMLMAKEKLRG